MSHLIKLAEMQRLQRQSVEDAVIDSANRWTHVGPDLVAVRCKIILGQLTSGVSFSRFEECEFIGMPPDELYWLNCELVRCRFLCDLEAHTFGPREAEHGGSVEACDFSQCWMDDCQFYCSSPEEQILPGWPIFALTHRVETIARLRKSGKWPKQAATELDVWSLAKQPGWSVSNAQAVARRSKVEVGALREALEGVEGIYISPRPAPPARGLEGPRRAGPAGSKRTARGDGRTKQQRASRANARQKRRT